MFWIRIEGDGDDIERSRNTHKHKQLYKNVFMDVNNLGFRCPQTSVGVSFLLFDTFRIFVQIHSIEILIKQFVTNLW